MIEYLTGMYIGIGICAGIAFYVDDRPFMTEDSRAIKAIQAFILAIGWLPFIVSAIGPMLIKDGIDWIMGGESDEQ